jgi:dCMP deaminase
MTEKFRELLFYKLKEARAYSDDVNHQTSAIIFNETNETVLATGWNGIPAGVQHSVSRTSGKTKYPYMEHAERNSIYTCAADGIPTYGKSMIMEWFPCSPCARAIIQSGIVKLYCGIPDFSLEKWGEDFRHSYEMLKESDVKVLFHSI